MEHSKSAFCIYINTLAEGPTPAVRDENDLPCVFETRRDAEREIVDRLMTQLREFLDNQRDFEDAVTIDEYVVEVEVQPDGSIVDEDDNHFGSRRTANSCRDGGAS